MSEWLTFYEAVNEIMRHLSVSRGEAEVTLRQLCASGKLWSQKQPYSIVKGEWHGEGPPERIMPSEWRDREIDMMTDSDGCNYSVRVEKLYFQTWLNQQKTKTVPPQQQRIIKYLKEWYPNGVPPDCSKKDLLFRLRECGDPNLKSLDAKTLRSALGKRR
jgi:hypothetical protein